MIAGAVPARGRGVCLRRGANDALHACSAQCCAHTSTVHTLGSCVLHACSMRAHQNPSRIQPQSTRSAREVQQNPAEIQCFVLAKNATAAERATVAKNATLSKKCESERNGETLASHRLV